MVGRARFRFQRENGAGVVRPPLAVGGIKPGLLLNGDEQNGPDNRPRGAARRSTAEERVRFFRIRGI